jgi:N-methylhydantoinase A
MSRALVPVHAGVLSALGMLAAPRARQLSRTVTGLLDDFSGAQLERQLRELAAGGRRELVAEGVDMAEIEAGYSLDLRYRGQSYTLNIPWEDLESARQAFHAAHEQRYGHRLTAPVELVNLRCNLHGRPPAIELPPLASAAGELRAPERVSIAGHTDRIPVWPRAALLAGQRLSGPALITETVATTWLPADWGCLVDPVGNLLLERTK